MFAIGNALRVTPRLSGIITRNSSNIVATPPTCKVTTAEKVMALIGCYAAFLISPMYFAPRFRHYAKLGGKVDEEEEEEE